MDKNLVYLGATNQKPATGESGHRVNVSRNALLSGLNLMATEERAVLPMFASILEDVMADEHRVICFHDNSYFYGISSHFDVLNIGGKIAGGELDPQDGGSLAEFALQNQDQHIFVNMNVLDSGEPARFVADFANVYGPERIDSTKFELVAYYAMSRSLPRTRDRVNDTRAAHDTMRFQNLGATRNTGILNGISSLSEVPREFVTNRPNLAFGRLTIQKHINELGFHIPKQHMKRIEMLLMDENHGIINFPDGPMTYYPGSDMPNSIGHNMPYVIEPSKLKSEIGKRPKNPTRPKGNKKLEKYSKFVASERQRVADEKEQQRIAELVAEARQRAEDKALKKRIEEERLEELGYGRSSTPARTSTSSPARSSIANDNLHDGKRTKNTRLSGTKDAAALLREAGIQNADRMVSFGLKAINAREGRLNVPLRCDITWRGLAERLIHDALLREAVSAGSAISQRYTGNKAIVVSGAAYTTAYYQALNDNANLARQFHIDMFLTDPMNRSAESKSLEQALKQLGTEKDVKRRSESQYLHLRSAWMRYNQNGETAARRAA